LPNVGPYIYDVSISGFTRSSIYIYDISSLRVNLLTVYTHQQSRVESSRVESSFAESKVSTSHVFIVVSVTSVTGRNGCCFALRNECYNVDYFS